MAEPLRCTCTQLEGLHHNIACPLGGRVTKDNIMALHKEPENPVPHEYGPSRVGHGESQCKWCYGTNRENAIISPNHCGQRALKDPLYAQMEAVGGMFDFKAGAILNFDYTNYKDETSFRHVMVMGLSFGRNKWYKDPQWFLRAWDFDKKAIRCFALNRIKPHEVIVVEEQEQEIIDMVG